MEDNQHVVIERPHSKVGPSSFERIEKCTQSVRLSAYAQPRLAGPAAQAGTACHHLLERCLKRGLDTFEIGDDKIKVDGHEVEITDEMLENVQMGLDWIRAHMPPPLLIEHRVRFTFADPYGSPMFGWLDVATAHGPPWIVFDAKFGFQLVPESHVQLMLYLLGLALEKYPTLTPNGTAGTVAVFQPNARAAPVRTADYTFAELRQLRDRVIAALARIKRQDWSFAEGEWCRYCPATAICPHLHAIALDPALTAVTPSPEAVSRGEISKERLEDLLDKGVILEVLLKQLNATAEAYLIHGGKLRNRKLVRKRTIRRWIDDQQAKAWLEEQGVSPWTEPVLVSPAQAEKRLPKGKRKLVDADGNDLAEQPPGELTITTMDDPKPGIEIGETLRNALKSRLAASLISNVKSEVQAKPEP